MLYQLEVSDWNKGETYP